MNISLNTLLKNAKIASKQVAQLSTDQKNKILLAVADALIQQKENIITENKKDIALEKANNNTDTDRLMLNTERIEGMASEVKNVASLHDHVGEIIDEKKMPSGIELQNVRVPLGVVAMIYESRPNVTIDAAALAFKSGNAIILKGGKEAAFSNTILANIFRAVLEKQGVQNAVQLMEGASRKDTSDLLNAKGKVDVLIPRGGKGLIDFVSKNSLVPVIETGASVVHTFVDESADLQMAQDIIINEKTRRTSVCNALDTILIDEHIAEKFVPQIIKALQTKGVEIVMPEDDDSEIFATEWLDMKVAIRVVQSIDEALDHIQKYSLGHSESIITNNDTNAEKFLNSVDAACVYHNASTCFSDGAQFGLGAEIGISTQKLHVRGPFALQGLTSNKWKVRGNGEIRD